MPESIFIDLEFDTGSVGVELLGNLSSSLVTIDELLRDLASMIGSGAEFRRIDIIAIEMRAPLTIRLSLHEIPADAIAAFQDICREVTRFRDREPRLPVLPGLTPPEAERMRAQVISLRNAAVPLKRVRLSGK